MASEILLKYAAEVEPTITLTSLGNGAGRICAVIDWTAIKARKAEVWLKVKAGTSPTANTPVKVYQIPQSGGSNNVKGGGGGLGDIDAAVSTEPINAPLIGAISVTSTSNASYSEKVATVDYMSAKDSFVVWNATGVALNGTPDTPVLQIVPIKDESQ